MGRVTVKKNLVVFHDPADWTEILEQLTRTYGNTIRMRHIMRRELGFTARDPVPYTLISKVGEIFDEQIRHHYSPQVHLDFFTETAHSWFQLKYLNRRGQDSKLF